MTKSGLADSPFFVVQKPPPASLPQADSQSEIITPLVDTPPARKTQKPRAKKVSVEIPVTPTNRDTKTPTNQDIMVSQYHDTIIELLRKAVKEFGKEGATYRFSTDEKQAMKDIIYAYGKLGITTSGNEITRIGFNFIVYDYKENGENSLLHKVLRELNK